MSLKKIKIQEERDIRNSGGSDPIKELGQRFAEQISDTPSTECKSSATRNAQHAISALTNNLISVNYQNLVLRIIAGLEEKNLMNIDDFFGF